MARKFLGNVLAITGLLATTLLAQNPRTGNYRQELGNRWLGGTVGVDVSLSTAILRSSAFQTTRRGTANLTAFADAKLLTETWRAAQLTCSASNTVTQNHLAGSYSQLASASFRVQLAGLTVWERSVVTTGNLGSIPVRTFRVFPTDPSAPIGIGPFTITLAGNCGATFGAGAGVILPTTSPEVRLVLSASTAIVASARVSVGAFGFGAGVELQGRFAEQRLSVSLIASAVSGLSGVCTYEMQAISLRLLVYLEALWQRVYEVTLIRWGSGWVSRDLLNL